MSFYADLYKVWGKNIKSLGWGSEQSQRCRFSIFLRQNIKEADIILDVGCGFADLKTFLLQHNYNNQYIGVEREGQFRDIALQSHKNIEIFDSFEEATSENRKYDWIFASGIFCFASDEDKWLANTIESINKFYSKAEKAVVINFLYDGGNCSKNKKMHYTSLSNISQIISASGTKKFNIYSDYKQNDISLALYK